MLDNYLQQTTEADSIFRCTKSKPLNRRLTYAKTWSGVEPWSGVVFLSGFYTYAFSNNKVRMVNYTFEGVSVGKYKYGC